MAKKRRSWLRCLVEDPMFTRASGPRRHAPDRRSRQLVQDRLAEAPAQLLQHPVEPQRHRVGRGAEDLGGLLVRVLLDAAEHHHLAVGAGQLLDRLDDLLESLVVRGPADDVTAVGGQLAERRRRAVVSATIAAPLADVEPRQLVDAVERGVARNFSTTGVSRPSLASSPGSAGSATAQTSCTTSSGCTHRASRPRSR